MKTLAAKGGRKEEEGAGNPGRGRHRTDQLQDRHAPIVEGLRPAERDAQRIAGGDPEAEADAPEPQRIEDADQQTRRVADINVEQALGRREERLRQPAELRRRHLPEGKPQAQGDEPRAEMHQHPPHAAKILHREGEQKEKGSTGRSENREQIGAAPRDDIGEKIRDGCRQRPAERRSKPWFQTLPAESRVGLVAPAGNAWMLSLTPVLGR